MNATGFAISSILCIALCGWMFRISRDPRTWRLLWLDALGLHDSDTPREQRISQETHVRVVAFMLFFLFVALGASCAFWSVDRVREGLRRKTSVERELNYLKKEVDAMKNRR